MRPGTHLLLSLALASPLVAQMPPGWNRQLPLGAEQPEGVPWYGFGVWAADKHGPPAILADSAGLGNALTGTGFHLEAGLKRGNWDLAAEWLGVRSTTGANYLTLYRGHATWQNRLDPGWRFGLEMEPLVWGYGLNGGYLLGEAARPFPRVRMESPMTELRLFRRVPLGTWGLQAFLGRLESGNGINPSIQDPRFERKIADANGIPQAPFMTGFRLQAEFSDFMEFYANYINLFGGSLNGRNMLDGYGLADYLTAMTGLKDALAESSVEPNAGTHGSPFKNKALSSSNADVGFRVRSRPLERWLGAEGVHGYVSRGSKGVWNNMGLFFRNPVKYGWRDIHTELKNAGGGRVNAIWNQSARYTSPNLATPNDAVGFLVAWQRVRLGLEYLDAVNGDTAGQGARTFTHYIYLAGFYRYGDPLGNSVAGEARTTTLRLETDLHPRLTTAALVRYGQRPFRDELDLWQVDHPGLNPVPNRFTGVQATLTWRVRPGTTLGAGAGWEHDSAVDNVIGAKADVFRWFGDLAWRWPAPDTRSQP
jgi:hypothetical protein